jgi:hypothetical protein
MALAPLISPPFIACLHVGCMAHSSPFSDLRWACERPTAYVHYVQMSSTLKKR